NPHYKKQYRTNPGIPEYTGATADSSTPLANRATAVQKAGVGIRVTASVRVDDARMSTPRRRLGTGPATSTRTTSTPPAPRLLPAERAELDALLGVADEHQAVPKPIRRHLGT